ncbi:MAG: ABC transporter permease [Nocardioides sp.]|uniref:ABC transporter permease n=1 Tax=Nocardioides sp. TaxID=35761 RepID=UPI003F11A609
MRTVLLASLRHNTRRYVASALAVVIGVAFIVATDGLAGALRSGMTADVGAPYERASHIVEAASVEEADSVLAAAGKQGVDASAVAQGWVAARTGSGSTFETYVGVAPDRADLQWQTLVDGTQPAQAGDLLVTEAVAAKRDLSLGDPLVVGTGKGAVEGTVVGITTNPVNGSDVQLLWSDLARVDGVWVSGVLWDGPASSAADVLGADTVVRTTADHVAELQSQVTQGVDVIALLVQVFAAIALGVAILVITNTFAILFAQRSRDFALLRCVGVTSKQLRRSVRVEALVLGVVAALVGVVAGVAAAYGLTALAGLWTDVLGLPSFQLLWVLGAAAVGVVVTLAAAWLPTRNVTRISPLAALRPAGGFDARSTAGRLRLATGAVAVLLGAGVLALAVNLDEVATSLVVMFAGGGLAFAGVLLVGPFVVPALVRAAGRLTSRAGSRGTVTRLATSNAVRNPRRTATTTASLMVGVTLTTAVLTGLGTISGAMAEETEEQYPLDAVAVATSGALPDGVGETLAGSDAVQAVEVLDGVRATIGGQEVPLVAAGSSAVLRGGDPFEGVDLVLPIETYVGLPDKAAERIDTDGTVDVRVAGEVHTLSVRLSDAYGQAGVVSAATLTALGGDPQPTAVWVRAADGADAGDLETAVNGATAGVEVLIGGGYADRSWIDTQMDVITAAVVGLLGIAVLIALIGIANTLGLSVLERTRENALLRAMGLTRTQLRRTLAVEGVLLAGVATLLGVAIGLAFAWVGVQVMLAGLVEATFSVPWVQLLVVVLVAGLSGVVASALPSRRAARVAPASGLALD